MQETPKRLSKLSPKINKGFIEKNFPEKRKYLPSNKDIKLSKLKFKQFIGKFEFVAKPKLFTFRFVCKNLTRSFVLSKAFSTLIFEVKIKQFFISRLKFLILLKFQETLKFSLM